MRGSPLTPDEAAAVVGVPAHQLRAWAWDRVGPRHVGTRVKPLYHEQDLREWLKQRVVPRKTHSGVVST